MTRKTKTRSAETTTEAYARLSVDIRAQIETLGFRLQIHEGSHRDRPTDWSLVGDLGHVRELLGELLAFLGSGR